MRPLSAPPRLIAPKRGVDRNVAVDPAPSVLSYRMQRLWLTPIFRALVRVGLPAFLIVGLVWMFLSQDENRAYLRGLVQELQVIVQNQPVHQLQTLIIDGASPLLAQEIRTEFGDLFPISAFELDLAAMRRWMMDISSVEHAAVIASPGGLLSVRVSEIAPEFIWRTVEGLQLVSARGEVLRWVEWRADYAHLPLIAGEGALEALSEARALLHTAAPIVDRLRGLVRVGERRWDVVLLDGQTIALPEANPDPVLAQVLVLSAAQDLFERDILMMDFRNPRRPTLRLRPQALAGLKQVKGVTFSEFAK
jgi:cell division protein FtsQ